MKLRCVRCHRSFHCPSGGGRYCSIKCHFLFIGFTKLKSKCWIWNGYKYNGRYGFFGHKGKVLYAHRASWLVFKSKIPKGLSVLHHCDNPSCVNPDHLFLGTQSDNMRDMDNKGRRSPFVGLPGEENPSSILTEQDVRSIRSAIARGASPIEMDIKYGIAFGYSRQIAARRAWKSVV